MRFVPIDNDGNVMFDGKVIVEQRSSDWKASLSENTGIWEVGHSPEVALRNLFTKRPAETADITQ